MGVPPKPLILVGCSLTNHPFSGTPNFGNPPGGSSRSPSVRRRAHRAQRAPVPACCAAGGGRAAAAAAGSNRLGRLRAVEL